ncbi:MAG: hypothetical protein AAGA48_40410, partial [Myxococcota bacterium]
SVIADGQFSECPLNLKEIQQITETFVQVLLGIYHQRIEYAETADISSGKVDEPQEAAGPANGVPPVRKDAMITLDFTPNRPQEPKDEPVHPAPPSPAEPTGVGPDPRYAVDADDDEDVEDYESVDYLPRGD